MKEKTFRILLASISGVMLGFAYPPVTTGITSIFAFVSLFILFETITSYGRVFRYSYLTFFIFNLIGMYWAGGFTHCKDLYMMIAGGLLLIAHPFFFYVPIAVWMLIRRNLSFK
ncbi:MAG: hypothetical protein HY800_07075, partial [Ignavibacteriales bacterium]|nr:hypothetical protein [Ignavibacteriales bacterium]